MSTHKRITRAASRIAVLMLVTVGLAGIQNGEPAQAAGGTTQRSWVYTEYRPAQPAVTHTATLTYSPSDSPYDAIKRQCAAQGLTAPQQGSDLERIVAHRGNFFTEQANGGYAAAAFMNLASDREYAVLACAGVGINWR